MYDNDEEFAVRNATYIIKTRLLKKLPLDIKMIKKCGYILYDEVYFE